MNGGHKLSSGVEGNLTYARLLFLKLVLGKTKLCGIVDDCSLSGVTDGDELAYGELSIGAKAEGNCKLFGLPRRRNCGNVFGNHAKLQRHGRLSGIP